MSRGAVGPTAAAGGHADAHPPVHKYKALHNNESFAYKALHNTDYMQIVLIIQCFICKDLLLFSALYAKCAVLPSLMNRQIWWFRRVLNDLVVQ